MATFGFTSVGTTYYTNEADEKQGSWGSYYTLGETGLVKKMTAYCAASVGTVGVRMGIYERVDALANAVLKGQTSAVSVPTGWAWRDFTFPSPILLSPGNYVFAFISNGDFLCRAEPGEVGNYRQVDVPDTYADGLSDPFGTGGSLDTDYALSIYATYDPVGPAEGVGSKVLLDLLLCKPFSDRLPKLKPLKFKSRLRR